MATGWYSAGLQDTEGLYSGALRRAHAKRCGWVVALQDAAETGEAFVRRLTEAATTFDAASLTLRTWFADGAALALAQGHGFRVDGQRQAFAPLHPEPHIARNRGALRHCRDLDG